MQSQHTDLNKAAGGNQAELSSCFQKEDVSAAVTELFPNVTNTSTCTSSKMLPVLPVRKRKSLRLARQQTDQEKKANMSTCFEKENIIAGTVYSPNGTNANSTNNPTYEKGNVIINDETSLKTQEMFSKEKVTTEVTFHEHIELNDTYPVYYSKEENYSAQVPQIFQEDELESSSLKITDVRSEVVVSPNAKSSEQGQYNKEVGFDDAGTEVIIKLEKDNGEIPNIFKSVTVPINRLKEVEEALQKYLSKIDCVSLKRAHDFVHNGKEHTKSKCPTLKEQEHPQKVATRCGICFNEVKTLDQLKMHQHLAHSNRKRKTDTDKNCNSSYKAIVSKYDSGDKFRCRSCPNKDTMNRKELLEHWQELRFPHITFFEN